MWAARCVTVCGRWKRTCFEGELVLLLAFIVIESTYTNPFPSAGIIFEWIPVPAIFIAGVRSGLLVIGPLSRVGLILIIAAHTGGGRKHKASCQQTENKTKAKNETEWRSVFLLLLTNPMTRSKPRTNQIKSNQIMLLYLIPTCHRAWSYPCQPSRTNHTLKYCNELLLLTK